MKPIQIRIDQELIQHVDDLAGEALVTRSRYIREAIEYRVQVEQYIRSEVSDHRSLMTATGAYLNILRRLRQRREYSYCLQNCVRKEHTAACEGRVRPAWLRAQNPYTPR